MGRALLLLAALLGACSDGTTLDVLAFDGFLARRGRQLELDGQPFRFVGLTGITLSGCGNGEVVPTTSQIDDLFRHFRRHTLVRTMATRNRDLRELEQLVGAARARGLKLVFILGEASGHCGDPDGARMPAWYTTAADGYRKDFLPWVRTVTEHFRDERAIAMWEIMRAPTNVDARTMRAFFDEVGSEIRRLAPNHLILSGTHAAWSLGGGDGYYQVHASRGIDVAAYSDWGMPDHLPSGLDTTMKAAAMADKPLVGTEVPYYASRAGDRTKLSDGGHPCLSWEQRLDSVKAMLDDSFRQGIAGVFLYQWHPREPSGCAVEFGPDDPLLPFLRDYQPPAAQ